LAIGCECTATLSPFQPSIARAYFLESQMCISRKENLSFEQVSSLFQYNKDNGLFFRNTGRGSYKREWTAGTRQTNGYMFFIIDGKKYLAHRLAFLLVHGRYPDGVIDHINGVRNDNRIENLRDVSQGQNTKNVKVSLARKMKFAGYHFDSSTGLWAAEAKVKRKRYHLGRFNSKEEAHQAYLDFMKKNEDQY
ncbi:HNH endonuclease, partial [Salmonella enterica]